MISEKIIYNLFLKVSRSQAGLPYRLRKQWHGFEETPHYQHVLRLKNFFSRNKSVDINDFFSAPYTIYPGESGFDLPFYSSPKAIKIYTLAQKKKLLLEPDDNYHLQSITKGLKYIFRYCKEKNIKIFQYPEYREGIHPAFISHLKENRVSIYNMFAFENFDKWLRTVDSDILHFILGDLYNNLDVFRTKFLTSKYAKKLSTVGLKKISEK
jgi:hypothetical protein